MSKKNYLFVLFPVAVATWCCTLGDRAVAGAYGFATLNISNFAVFTEDSVPNGSRTGNQLDTSDLLPRLSGSSGGPSQDVELDSSRSSSGGVYSQRCIGVCGFSEDDFTPPPMAPTDPTGLGAFARTDISQSGDLFARNVFSTRDLSTLAETEITRPPTRGSAVNRARYERGVTFVPAFTDELVIDFDAETFQRTLSDLAAPGTYVTASSQLVISLTGPGFVPLLSFTPDGKPGGSFGAIEISDPVDLNSDLISHPLPAGGNSQHFGSGQFRVITPTLTRDVAYALTITQIVEVHVAVVPEPSSLVMIAAIAIVTIGYRM